MDTFALHQITRKAYGNSGHCDDLVAGGTMLNVMLLLASIGSDTVLFDSHGA